MEPHKIFITNLYVIASFFFFFFFFFFLFLFINYRRAINVNDIFYLIFRLIEAKWVRIVLLTDIFYVAKWIFNDMGIFTKWIYVKLAFFFINYQRPNKENDIFYLIF